MKSSVVQDAIKLFSNTNNVDSYEMFKKKVPQSTLIQVDHIQNHNQNIEYSSSIQSNTQSNIHHYEPIEPIEPTQLSEPILTSTIEPIEPIEPTQLSEPNSIDQQQCDSIDSDDRFLNVDFKNRRNTLSNILISQDNLKLFIIGTEEYYMHNLKWIIKLQNSRKVKKTRKEYLKKLSRYRYRKNVIKELVQTEDTYVNDLRIMQFEIVQVLLNKNILDNLTIKKIFLNIDSILGINSNMYEQLKDSYDKYYPYQKTMEVVVVYITFFKLYFDYCNGYQKSVKFFNQKYQENEIFAQFVRERQRSVLKNQELISYIVKPVQRLPKYILLYKDLLKHTDMDHPDYQNISACLKEFTKINDANNQNLNKQLAQIKMQELHSMFHKKILIVESNREFLYEETCSIYQDHQENSVLMYLFNNLIILACREQQKQQYYTHITLNSNSLLKNQQNSQFFKNMFSVTGANTTIQFIAESEQKKEQLMDIINKVLLTLKENAQVRKKKLGGEDLDFQVKVEIIGTEERNADQFDKYTVYISEIKIEDIGIKLFLRFSQIRQLEQKVRKQWPKLNLPKFSKKFMNSHSAKIIEERRIEIEKFLQILLTQKEMKEDGQQILEMLALPYNFYELPIVQKKMIQSQSVQVNNMEIMEMQQKLTKSVSILLSQKSLQEFRESAIQLNKSKVVIGYNKNSELQIVVMTLDNNKYEMGCEKQSRVCEVIRELSGYLGLECSLDFKLYLQDKNKQRLLDDEEPLGNLVQQNKLKNLLNISNTTFILKKYMFLSLEQEEQDYKRDPVRLNLIAYQILDEIRSEKYYLTFHDYCLYAALYAYFQCDDKIVKLSMNMLKQLKPESIIPVAIYKQNKDKIWMDHIFTMLQSLSLEIKTIYVLSIIINIQLSKRIQGGNRNKNRNQG